MRLAILADIHGNLPAFEAALDHVARQRVDQIIVAGDIVNGAPDSSACLQLALSLRCPLLRGNHERYVADFATPQADPAWSGEQFAPLRWTAGQLSPDERVLIGDLPLHHRVPGTDDLLIVHASERGDYDSIYAYTPDSAIEEMFPRTAARVIVRAHNHAPQTRVWDDRLIITAGSVGLPLDSNPQAQYCILERRQAGWRIEHHTLPYDLDGALRRFSETGYLDQTGPIGMLYMRELATATFYIVPFLRYYNRWSAEAPVTLGEALRRFLRADGL